LRVDPGDQSASGDAYSAAVPGNPGANYILYFGKGGVGGLGSMTLRTLNAIR
jgi:hypothetical protein